MMDKLCVNERLKFSRQPIPIGHIRGDPFPIIVKIVKCDVEGCEVTNREILRINHDGYERRVLAVDSARKLWSFPVHTGAKFDVIGKGLDSRSSVFMREIVEHAEVTTSRKRTRRIRFSQTDGAEIRVAGQEPGDDDAPGLLQGDFKVKDVTRVRFFVANRIVDDEIDPKVIVLPASLDVQITMATGLKGMPSTAMTSLMDKLTSEINAWVNFNLCRGSPDILFYDVAMKTSKRRSKGLEDLARLQVSPKIVRISTNYHQQRARPQPTGSRDRRQRETEIVNDTIKGSAMAAMMASSRGESFRKKDSGLQWIRTAGTSAAGSSSGASFNVLGGEEANDLNEEEKQALIRHRMRLLQSLDDYGYGSEQDATESRARNDGEDESGGGDKDEVGSGEPVTEVDDRTDNLNDNISDAMESGINIDLRDVEPGATSAPAEIDVPIVVEETDGSTRVVWRDKPVGHKKSQRRYGDLFGSSSTSPFESSRPFTLPQTDEPGDDGAPISPVLGKSNITVSRFSESNYVSITKKWTETDNRIAQSVTSRNVTKRKSLGQQFFTLSRAHKTEDNDVTNRRKSGPADISVTQLGPFTRVFDFQGL